MGRIGLTSEDKFRINYSSLMEHYQFIEFHLEGIYASICEEGFSAGMENVKADSVIHLLERIKEVERKKNLSVLPESDYEKLTQIWKKRNFWCHDFFVYTTFSGKTRAPKDIKPLIDSLFEAEEIREYLYQLKTRIMLKYLDDRQSFVYPSCIRRADI